MRWVFAFAFAILIVICAVGNYLHALIATSTVSFSIVVISEIANDCDSIMVNIGAVLTFSMFQGFLFGTILWGIFNC